MASKKSAKKTKSKSIKTLLTTDNKVIVVLMCSLFVVVAAALMFTGLVGLADISG